VSREESKFEISLPKEQGGAWIARITFLDSFTLREFCGASNRNLKILQKNTGVQLKQNADKIVLLGEEQSTTKQSLSIMIQLLDLLEQGKGLHPAEVDQFSRMLMREPDVDLSELYRDTVFVGDRKKRIYPRSLRQRYYCQAINNNDLVFGVGPAGTGKTFLAMAMALSALYKEEVKRIILCRPAVEAGEKLGFLPGDLVEKVNPYLRPLYDALNDLAGADKAERLMSRGIVEVAPLAFMRGRTLSEAFVILDEAQNTTPEQMKMFLTRIGIGSKAVVTGDPSQVDLPRNQTSGLRQSLSILNGVDGIEIVRLLDSDVVRHPLVSAIIRAYNSAGMS
jgi:phosphate starvation-inducible PhoH-like protein